MGYFFRKSANIGPFRLNFSKSGVGASIGVKGARLTMTPRGTTYITVGSHGFYYRETLSTKGGGDRSPITPQAPPQAQGVASDEIRTADIADLVDSSSEVLVRHLNERAAMFNPAWLLYPTALIAIFIGIGTLQEDTSNPPETVLSNPASYDSFVASYGYPNIVVASNPLAIVPVRKSSYVARNVGVTFVPASCAETYQKVMQALRDQKRSSALAKQEIKKLRPCKGQPNATWQPVGYVTLDENKTISNSDAKLLLGAVTNRNENAPTIDSDENGAGKKPTSIGSASKGQNSAKPVWAAAQNIIDQVRAEKRREAAARNTRMYWGYLLMLGGGGVFVAGVMVHKQNKEKRTSHLFYELNETEGRKYSVIQQSVHQLSQAHQVWRVEANSPTWDWKRNAGASNLVRRVSSRVGYSNPPRVESNLKVPSITVGRPTLYFLPDLLLYWENGSFGAIAYGDLQIEHGLTQFIEDGFVPSDAVRVGTTWRYVRRDGGPDRRFNNNSQLPVLQYGTLHLRSSHGLNIFLHTSTARASAEFAGAWLGLDSRRSRVEAKQSAAENKVNSVSSPDAQARKVLGVSETASLEEVSAAYRKLAQMYHPDKVAGLAPEFQVLADQRMKEINAAYEQLKRK